MPADDTIRKRDQERLRQWSLTLGSPVQSRDTRVALQYLQALDVCDLLTQSANRKAEFASAALFRFGLDTLATGFWIACIATDEWLRGHGNVHIPSNLERTIATLPLQAQKMLEDVVNSGFAGDSKRTLLKDVLNPATHGDALVSAMRIGSATAQGKNWAQYLSRLMNELTHNFVVLIRELGGIDLEAVAAKYSASAPQD
ncbi:MAG: hypothetical protein WB729_05575 [Candidatus Sulfotelmatobacter sp.]